jgi:U-box domain
MNSDNTEDQCQKIMTSPFTRSRSRQRRSDTDCAKCTRKIQPMKRKEMESYSVADQSVPSGFICPLTMEIMFDPVLDAEGNTFERSALFQWLKHSPTSPVSRQPLNERMVTANNALRDTIHEFMGSAWLLQRKTSEETKPEKKMKGEQGTSSIVNAGKEMSRSRSKIDCFLHNTSKEIGGIELSLNSDGCCAFRYDSITIVLDVPENVGVFCLYTKDLIQGITQASQDQICRRAMELNFLQGTSDL